MATTINEKRLLYRVLNNKNPEAFGELYDAYVARIYRFIFFKVTAKEEAEDVTSEVFLKTWNYLTQHKKQDVQSFSGLIYKVARNCLVDYYRHKSVKQECSIDTISEIGIYEEQYHNIAVEHEVSAILLVLKKLKREYQEIILLKYIEDLSIREIAEILDKSAVNARVTLHRAMRVLRKLLAEVGMKSNI